MKNSENIKRAFSGLSDGKRPMYLADIMEWAGAKEKMVRNWWSTGKLPSYKVGRYRVSSVAVFMAFWESLEKKGRSAQ